MARNLNLVARSFYKMPTRFFALHSRFFSLHGSFWGLRKNAYVSACRDIYIRCAKKYLGYRFSDIRHYSNNVRHCLNNIGYRFRDNRCSFFDVRLRKNNAAFALAKKRFISARQACESHGTGFPPPQLPREYRGLPHCPLLSPSPFLL